jgi:hypothetical protein
MRHDFVEEATPEKRAVPTGASRNPQMAFMGNVARLRYASGRRCSDQIRVLALLPFPNKKLKVRACSHAIQNVSNDDPVPRSPLANANVPRLFQVTAFTARVLSSLGMKAGARIVKRNGAEEMIVKSMHDKTLDLLVILWVAQSEITTRGSQKGIENSDGSKSNYPLGRRQICNGRSAIGRLIIVIIIADNNFR